MTIADEIRAFCERRDARDRGEPLPEPIRKKESRFWVRPPKPAKLPLSPDRKAYLIRHARAEREYLEHARDETGQGASPEEIERQLADRTEVRRQSHLLAERLEYGGKSAYRTDAFFLWIWWVHSRRLDLIPNFRRICLLPYIAAIVRASKLAALEYFIQRNPFCRFWTFTTGDRVGLDGLRKRCQWLHRRLSQLNAYLRGKYGVELVFRSTEFGTLEFDDKGNRRAHGGGNVEFDADGSPLFHVHAHCVIRSLVGFIPTDRWKAMFDDVWKWWGFNWDGGKKGASGIIRNARECCKYVTKPGDLLKLSPEHLGRMHEAVFRLKLCQPMGTLRTEMKARKEAGLMLRRYRLSGCRVKGCEWREVGNQNEHLKTTAEERAAADNYADAQRFAAETAAAVRVDVLPPSAVQIQERTTVFSDGSAVRERVKVGGEFTGTKVRTVDRSVDFCRVFSRLSPGIGPGGLKEPRVVVGGTRFDRALVESHPLVARLWAQTVEHWEAGRCISVHTGTPTVADPPGYSHPEPFAVPPDPEFCSL